jgi:CxxC motif-containing protein (DUF1111 family)
MIEGSYADGTPYELVLPTYSFTKLNYGEMHPDVMTSPRIAPQMIGLGLLEAIPEEGLLAHADETDRDSDGISGRPNYVWDKEQGARRIGRFGWKANQPSIAQQTAGAFLGDIGITTRLFPQSECTEAQAECRSAPDGGEPEASEDRLQNVILYARTLAVPAQREARDQGVRRGELLFSNARCDACHVSSFETGDFEPVPELAHQTIRPYSDLLLHDMGDRLADGRPDYAANGREWRTPPLWGTGLAHDVTGSTNYMHDGRARTLEEAILWHDGEAKESQIRFVKMDKADREAMIRFLESL